MALSQKKSTERKAHMMVVKRAYKFDNNNISFDLEIDGWITIYNMLLVATYSEKDKSKKDKSKCIPEAYFVSFPSHKDDKGNYYNYAYFKIIPDEQDVIEEQIEHLLDETEEK